MSRLISIGHCLVDIEQIAAVEAHRHGYQSKYVGARITLKTGAIIYEEGNSLRVVKEIIAKEMEVKP
ncbi:TPA: hypothetical protein ACPTCW_002338 [Yersinia enterocolitica]